ncbi:tyrosine recombinase XerC [Clostridia bacterium]|nr:tyrosine recombinase XerC [Clostridia bacterium]
MSKDYTNSNNNLIDTAPLIIREFLIYMKTIKGKSPNTVDEYYLDLRTFFRFIKMNRGLISNNVSFNEIPIDDINIDFIKAVTLTDAYEFMNYIMSDRDNNATTRARKSSSLKSFFNYLTTKKALLANDPFKDLEAPKIKRALPKYLTLEQSLELLNAVDGKYKERDYCILTILLNCGIRLSELAGLNYSSVRDDNTMVVTGKGNKQRVVYLNAACMAAINDYKKIRPVDGVKDKNALFISRNMNRLSPKTIQDIVYKYIDKIGLGGAGYSVHKLRHTAATLMYQHGGVDIRVLQDILGHANLGTTEIYTHLSSEQKEKAVESNPLSKVKKRKNKA